MLRRLTLLCVLGLSAFAGALDSYTVEYDSLFGGGLPDAFRSVIADSTGNAYVGAVATVNSGGTRAWKIVKYSTTGAISWTREVNIANQAAVGDHALMGLGPSNSVFATDELTAAGVPRAVVVRLHPVTGAILWQTEVGFRVESKPVVSGSRVFTVVSNNLANPRFVLIARGINNGAILWTRDLGPSVGGTRIVLVVDASGTPYTYLKNNTSVTLSKMDAATGVPTWIMPINESMNAPGDLAVLQPSGNLALSVPSTNAPRFHLLRSSDGAILRTETTPNVSVSIAAGLADSYYRFERSITGLFDYRDANGIPFAQGSYDDDPSDNKVVDPTGQFQFGEERSYIPTGRFEFKLSRCAARVEQFFPIDNNQVVNSVQHDNAASGNSIFMVGQVELLSGDIQARIVKVKQNLEVRSDSFSTLYRTNPVVLNVLAPGVLANDSGTFGGIVTVVNTTSNGTLTLANDGSFSYLPNNGFSGQDSFVYKVRVGSNEVLGFSLINVITLASVTVPQPEVVGGVNLVGTVNLSGQNRSAPIVVPLTDNAASVLVTSSVAIPFGQSSANFNVITSPVAADETCTITGTLMGITRTAQLIVRRPTPISLTLSTNSLVGGQPFTGTVVMTGKSPSGGIGVTLTHSGTEIGMPTSLLIPTGADTASFNGTTQPRSTAVTHVITATSGGVSKTSTLTLNPGGLFALTITPASVTGGQNATGKVQVAGVAPGGGTLVNLSVNGSRVSIPSTVTVPGGTQFQTFNVQTQSVVATTTRTVTATFGNITRTATITLNP